MTGHYRRVVSRCTPALAAFARLSAIQRELLLNLHGMRYRLFQATGQKQIPCVGIKHLIAFLVR